MKIIVVAGARPNFMKIQPLLSALSKYNSRQRDRESHVNALLVHTGQHYDENMSDIFFQELGINPPDINLNVGSASHAVQTANIMTRFEAVCDKEKADWVIVVGDVNSTMACAIVCAKIGIKVAHIEAGLRSFDRTMPEEINRVITDALADMLFTPSEDADQNLIKEGIPEEKIKFVGNIMIDSLLNNLDKARASKILERLEVKPGEFVYVTLHRPGNVDDPARFTAIINVLKEIAFSLPVIFPVHPRTRKIVSTLGINDNQSIKLKLLEPIGYHDSLCLAEKARLVLTDSGGLQEETTFFRTPCLTLRPSTERPITITLGSNRLTKPETLSKDIENVLKGPERFGQIPPLWDGKTAERIVQHLITKF